MYRISTILGPSARHDAASDAHSGDSTGTPRASSSPPQYSPLTGDPPYATDVAFMRLAIQAAREARAVGNMPFGAVLASGTNRLFIAGNEALMSRDCTAHAELVLVRKASALHGPEALHGATVYTSGEPCAMCAGALFWAGIARIVYGATSEDITQALGGPSLPARCADTLASALPQVRVEGPVLRDEAVAALKLPSVPPPALDAW
jgi:tRNA(adenine34) deaminase